MLIFIFKLYSKLSLITQKYQNMSKKILYALLFTNLIFGQEITPLPFSTDDKNITVWNGEAYVPLFIKGINLGVSKPGTYPGELAARHEDYKRWFPLMREAGFNTIRVYTLHFPQFYDELKAYNEANPNHPIYVFHGVWLEEEIPDYHEDLFSIQSIMDKEIIDNVNAVHGNAVIEERRGKAYGTYTSDISPWVIGYIVGREIHPPEVLKTNEDHPNVKSFNGNYLSINNTNASEAWLLERLDKLVTLEQTKYKTQRPVSISSWPTLDPITHPEEKNPFEDSAVLDFSEVNKEKAKAGFFISYHAYPYYPDFIGSESKYQSASDYLGQNSYVGYLTDLKSHYKNFPLIIAEYGVPSSWGVAHYTTNGMYHGGYDETKQGELNIRLLENIHTTGCGGGMMFAWLDEWFKRTWITDPMDFNVDRRILWHNVTSPEQNFGIIGYKKDNNKFENVETFCTDCPVKSIEALGDFAYFKLKLNTQKHLKDGETLWVSLDTYDKDLGESTLPNGKKVTTRAEFVVKITNNKAELYVTEAYDLYGIWHHTAAAVQKFRSTVTDGAPWNIVRWKNNDPEKEIQYIGSLGINRLNLPLKTTDAVILKDTSIEIRLPWTLINVIDPSKGTVMHDDRDTKDITETVLTDGISVGIVYNDFQVETKNRFNWDKWEIPATIEYKKEVFEVVKSQMINIPCDPIAMVDKYVIDIENLQPITKDKGLLVNDLSLSGANFEAVLATTPKNGILVLNADGSFNYTPTDGFIGVDTFQYSINTDLYWSKPVTVELKVTGKPKGEGLIKTYPNPVIDNSDVTIESKGVMDRVEVYTAAGLKVKEIEINSNKAVISVTELPKGTYFFVVESGQEKRTKKIIINQ